jgi:hypothetical protein
MSILRFLTAFRTAVAERVHGRPRASPEAVEAVEPEAVTEPEIVIEPEAVAEPASQPEVVPSAAAAEDPVPEPTQPVVASPIAKRPRKRKSPDAPSEAPAPKAATRGRRRKPAVETPAPTSLQTRDDPEAEALRSKIVGLDTRIAELAASKAVIDEAILAFQIAQYQALGATLENCLRLRLEFLRLKAARSGAEEDLQAEREAAADCDACAPPDAEDGASMDALSAEERAELKQRYRSAAMRCHPDRVPEARKAIAEGFFLRLEKAYRSRDLAALRVICRELDGTADLRVDDPSLPGCESLRRRLSDLQDHAADLILAVQSGQLDPLYRKAIRPADWEADFAEARERLEGECEMLTRQIRILARG